MAPLNTIQKTSIIKRIDFIEIELKDLDEYANLDFKTYARDRKVRKLLMGTANGDSALFC